MTAREKRLLVCGVPLALLVGVLACFGDDAVGASINSALASVAGAFPDIPYSQVLWLYTMPKIVIVPVTLASGFIVGRRVSYRHAAIAGFSLIAFGGMAPVLLNDFWAILASRFVMGIGLGIQAPIGPALVMRFFSDRERRARVLGYGHAFINIYGVVTNLLVGFLCVIEWRYAFLAYGTILVLLVIAILFLRDPSPAGSARASAWDEAVREEGADPAAQMRWWEGLRALPRSVFCLLAAYLVTLCLWGVAGLNLSAIIQANGLGDAASAGVLLSLINVSGMIAGVAFGSVSRVLGRYTLAFGYALMAVGFVVYCLASSLVVLGAGIFIAGLANTLIITGFEAEVGERCSSSQVSLGMSLCMVVSQLSGFLCGFYISFVMDGLGLSGYEAPVALSAGLLMVMGAAFAVWAWVRGCASRAAR